MAQASPIVFRVEKCSFMKSQDRNAVTRKLIWEIAMITTA